MRIRRRRGIHRSKPKQDALFNQAEKMRIVATISTKGVGAVLFSQQDYLIGSDELAECSRILTDALSIRRQADDIEAQAYKLDNPAPKKRKAAPK
jgi:hypothetical protein